MSTSFAGRFLNYSPVDYIGSDGSDPTDGPWSRWCAGNEPAFEKNFALFSWWNFCEALDLFVRADGKEYPDYVATAEDGAGLSGETLARMRAELNDHLDVLIALRGRPLDLMTRLEEGDLFASNEFDNYSPIRLAAAYALWCIDQGISGILQNEAGKSAAGFAYSAGALDLADSYRRQSGGITTLTIKAARSDMGRRGAKAKHAADPRQSEKAFVKSCWHQWHLEPDSYSGKASFARDMLSKCEHLISQKQIEDWCRDWERELM